jgi:hypothetical protein
MVAAITLLFVCIGVGYGVVRKPAYTAEARLTVARFAVPDANLSGFVQAAQGLAVAYASAINADAVVRPVSQTLHMSEKDVRSNLSASPLSESPVLRVLAVARDRSRAIALANAGSTALQHYAATLNLTNPNTARLLRAYRAATKVSAAAGTRASAADAAFNRKPSPANRAALIRTRSDLRTAELEEETLRNAYQASQTGQGSAAALEQLAGATGASSDRSSKLQIAGFAGLVLGLLFGLSLALLSENRRAARAARVS